MFDNPTSTITEGTDHMTDPQSLVDQPAIDQAARRLSDLRQRHAAAVQAVPQAAAAVDAAKRQHVQALTAGNDPQATKRAVLDATAEHALASEMVDALADEINRFQFLEMPTIVAAAHDRLAAHAFAELAATAVKFDALEAAHVANDERYRRAIAMLSIASAAQHNQARAYCNNSRATPREPVLSHPVAHETALQGA